MADFAEIPLTEFDRGLLVRLQGKSVVKALARQSSFQGLPRYVTEYLLAKFVKPESWKEDIAKVETRIRDLLPNPDRREMVKEKLLSTGEVTLIDQVDCRVDLKEGRRWARVPTLDDNHVGVSQKLLEEHSGLLMGGLWGTLKVRYSPELDSSAPNELASFTPFQVGPPDMAEFRAFRSAFSTADWIALMLQSAGYDPAAFPTPRLKMLLLTRLIPLVERNVNLIELGPRQTGKTFLLRNISPRVFTISGGKTTPANLFVNLATGAIGILGSRKVVVFDEIAHTSFDTADGTISILKDFMESGQYTRGNKQFLSDAGIFLAGNLDVLNGQPHPRYRHLFEPLPESLHDSAFHDRLHGYLPGWEIPKISPASLANGVGFVTDYFGEALVRLREDNHHQRFQHLQFDPGMTRRDHVAVEKLASGYIKLLHPDGNMTREEFRAILDMACELRQRVHDQLATLAPGEFRPKRISFKIPDEPEPQPGDRELSMP
ncbi:MAG: BREX system Lon protease-like protein BrxL [Gemmataceae bacterium]|nr:BREX system Lon protease-like protein BrxL [Gemmataceae bacterium]